MGTKRVETVETLLEVIILYIKKLEVGVGWGYYLSVLFYFYFYFLNNKMKSVSTNNVTLHF